MKFVLFFILVNVGALSFVQCTGESGLTHHQNLGPKNRKLSLSGSEPKSKKERIFFGDDSLNFGYSSGKLSFGGSLHGFNGLGHGHFGAYYRPPFYGPYGGGGGIYGHFGGFGGGFAFPYKYHHHHHHQYHGGYHQPFGGFGYYK